jgi:outer membrane protein assembly factor BamB
VIAVLAAVLAAVVVVYALGRRDDGMRGPFGAFPSPIAAAAPPRSARLLATLPGDVRIYGGLALQAYRADVRAVDIRTGKVFWADHRDGDSLKSWDVDDTGALFILWLSGRVEGVDVRSGKLRWHQRINGDVIVDDSGTGLVDVVPAGSDERLVAFDRRTGRERWRLKPDKAPVCEIVTSADGDSPLAVGGNLVVIEDCHEYGADLSAYDAAGHRRWQLDLTDLVGDVRDLTHVEMTVLDDRLVTVSNSSGGTGYALVDTSTGRMVKKIDHPAVAPSVLEGPGWGLTSVTDCYISRSVRALCAGDVKTGRRLWRVPLPKGFNYSSHEFSIFGGRLYTVLYSTSGSGDVDPRTTQVAVLDVHTGAVLGRIPIPKRSAGIDGDWRVNEVAGGVIAVISGSGRGDVKLLAE